jgi:hypothetical protein
MLQSVPSVQHSNSAKWKMLWTYVLNRVWWLDFLLQIAQFKFIYIWEVCVVITSQMLAQIDAGSVVLRALKMTFVTGPQRLTSYSSDEGDQRQCWCADLGWLSFTTSEQCAAIGNGKPVVIAFIREFGYRKVCARLVLKTHKELKITSVQNFSSMVWKTEMMITRQSGEWHHNSSP